MVLSRFDQLSREDVLSVVGANAVPLVGLAYLDWTVSELILLYWAEIGLSIAFSVPYVLLYDLGDLGVFEKVYLREDIQAVGMAGMFWLMTGWIMSYLGYPDGIDGGTGSLLRIVAPALLASAVVSARRLYLNYRRSGPRQQLQAKRRIADPLYRIFYFGFFLAMGMELSWDFDGRIALVVFVVLKVILELGLEVDGWMFPEDDEPNSTSDTD